jgi:hypothetical protein
MGFSFITEVKVADFLTSITIVISLIIFLRSLSKDRKIKQRESANKIRYAASKTIAKLDRWQELSICLYQNVKPHYVDISQSLKVDFNISRIRDLLWQNIEKEQANILKQILDEQIEIAYVDLLGYHPDFYDFFNSSMNKLKKIQIYLFEQLCELSQEKVLYYVDKQDDYLPAELGNQLRGISFALQDLHRKKTDEELKQMRGFLRKLINTSDKELLMPVLPSTNI